MRAVTRVLPRTVAAIRAGGPSGVVILSSRLSRGERASARTLLKRRRVVLTSELRK